MIASVSTDPMTRLEWLTTADSSLDWGNPLAPAKEYVDKVRKREILLLFCNYCHMTYPALEEDQYRCPSCGAADFEELT